MRDDQLAALVEGLVPDEDDRPVASGSTRFILIQSNKAAESAGRSGDAASLDQDDDHLADVFQHIRPMTLRTTGLRALQHPQVPLPHQATSALVAISSSRAFIEFELWRRAHFGPKCREHEGSSDICIDVSPKVSGMPTWGDTRWCMFFNCVSAGQAAF